MIVSVQPPRNKARGVERQMNLTFTSIPDTDTENQTFGKDAADGGFEPILQLFCTAANVCYRSVVKNRQQPPRF